MPVTHFAAGVRPHYAGVDYRRAIKPVGQIGLPPTDRVCALAVFVVRRGRTDQTARQYGWMIARVLRWFLAEGIDPLAASRDDLLFWWNTLAGLAPNTKLGLLGVVHQFYGEAVEREWIRRDPSRAIKAEPRETLLETPALTAEQVERLLASIRAELNHPERGIVALRDLGIIALLLRLCLREDEVAKLGWRMFITDRGEPVVRFIGKWHKPARLAVPDDVLEVLNTWRDAFEREAGVHLLPNDPLFVGLNLEAINAARARKPGMPLKGLSRATIYQIVANRLRDIGIEGDRYGPHCLRATGVTLAFEAGADLLECQALLRHRSVETTRQYLKRGDGLARICMERMPIRIRALNA